MAGLIVRLIRLAISRAIRLAEVLGEILPGWWPRQGPAKEIPGVVRVTRRAELPRRLSPRRVYLIGTPAKWAVFRCPCGTGHRVDLNLAHEGRPRWSVTLGPAHRPSLRPSVDVRASRRCHFWLTDGRVRWCHDSD